MTSMPQLILRRCETSAMWSFASGLGQEGMVVRLYQLIELHDRREPSTPNRSQHDTPLLPSPSPGAHLFSI